MSNEYVWQPKDDQENAILAAANHLLRFGHPPVGERLCRRVPAPQGVSVPVEIADILRPLVNEVHWARYGSEDDEQRAALVRYWLDAQPSQPGQEVD